MMGFGETPSQFEVGGGSMDVIYKPRKTRHPICFASGHREKLEISPLEFLAHFELAIRKCCILEFVTWKFWKIWSAEYC